jgi:CPA1 family monovalent cation:H+ antiporter
MSILALVSILVTVTALFGWLSARARIPQTIGSLGLTMLGSIGLLSLGSMVPALRGWAFAASARVDLRELIIHGVLGLLLFAGAALLDLSALRREWFTVGMLAVFATLLSTAGVAGAMYLALPLVGVHGTWLDCLLFGALISPTDPIAVLEMLGRAGVGKRIEAQLAGESLFNDGVGAVFFLTALRMAEGRIPTVGRIAADLVLEAGGGLLLGVFLAWVTSQLMTRVNRYQVEILLTLALALGGYSVAEGLHVSAPLEAVAAGLAIRAFNNRYVHAAIAHEQLERFWTVIDEVQNAMLFVLLGFELLAIPFWHGSFLAGAVAVLTVVGVRAGSVTLVLAGLGRMLDKFESSKLALTWGGLRGGLSIALALSVPRAEGRGWILTTTYMVVVFSVLVQGGTLGWVMRRWGGTAVKTEPRMDVV